jgi:hypothetical protein
MENTETNQITEIKNVLSADKKSFIGFLLSLSGVFFMLLGLMIFIGLIYAIYTPTHDIVAGLIVAALVVGVASFAVGSTLHK